MSKIEFDKPYKREDFLNFFQNEFLPEDFQISEEEIDLNFQAKYIKNVTKLGECPGLMLKVYEITHESENDPRVSLTKEAFRLMKVYNDFYVIAIFKSRNPDNFRLSYVTIGIKPEDKKIEYKYSNPRRYSFFLGPDAQVHTPEAYLIKKGRIKSFDDLQERFSIEVVNKEFYRKIAHLFTKLVGGKRKEGNKTNEYEAILKLPSCNDHKKMQEFAVRLIGRIMFCWFLKKKTTPNRKPIISGEILSFGAVKTSNDYYHSILEKLFFQVLNKPLEKRRKEFQKGLLSEIPFLNGGLFEPQDDDFYDIDESTGVSKYINVLKIPDSWFEELLYLLETYNFTIDESTPIDIELSIDPEMLGRIFENLLAEINPETGETVRKSTGSYYTPRPIVEYMVDESLKQYLITKTEIEEQKMQKLLSYYSEKEDDLSDKEKDQIIDALDKVKIIDPACGSSAFPIGILQKMVLILQKVDPDSMNWLIKQLDRIPDTYVRKMVEDQLMKEDWDYIRKLGIIQNSIYGVDIQEIAVEISKLRVFLSLIVDAKVDENEDNLGIKPLPNLEFKFVCADSLIGLPERTASMFEAKDQIKELKSLRDRYFSSYGDEKHRIEKKFKVTQGQMSKYMFDMNLEKGKTMDEQTFALSDWDPFSYKQSDWFDPEWMFGIKEGFDIVIGNPPYVDSENMVKNMPKERQKIAGIYNTASGNWDLYIPFFELGFNILIDSGNLTYIAPNKWLSIGYGKKLRDYFVDYVIQLCNCDSIKVFEAGNTPEIAFVEKKSRVEAVKIHSFNEDYIIIDKGTVSRKVLRLGNWGMVLSEKLDTLLTILNNYNRVDDYCDVENPFTVSEAYEVKKCVNEGEYGVHNENLMLITTGTIDKYISLWGKKKTSYIKDKYQYPFVNIKKFKRILPKRYEQSISTKIIIAGIRYFECFFDANGHYVAGKSTIIIRNVNKKITFKSLLAILNSSLISFYIKEAFSATGIEGGVNFTAPMIKELPMPEINQPEITALDKLSSKVISVTDGKYFIDDPVKQAKVKALEAEIDQLVYKLYDLTPEEIKIVEGETIDKSQKHISENLDDDSRMESNKNEEIICPNCGTPMVFKKGDFNDFYICSRFPECRKSINASLIDEVIKKDK